MKYRNRVRSRISNLKDPKNPSLRRNVLCGAILPSLIARMTAEVGSKGGASGALVDHVHAASLRGCVGAQGPAGSWLGNVHNGLVPASPHPTLVLAGARGASGTRRKQGGTAWSLQSPAAPSTHHRAGCGMSH